MNNLWRVLKASWRINVQTELAYRSEAVIGIVMSIFWVLYEIASLGIIFSNTRTIGGWGFGELIALTGVWKMMNSIMMAVVWPNTEKFNQGVRDGSLDFMFLQPVNSQLMVTINRLVIWRIADVVLALVTIGVGLALSTGLGSPLNVLWFVLLTITGCLIIYSLWIFLISLTFWFTKFDNSVTILHALLDSGRFPATVYPIWLRAIITFVIPIAIAMTVPLQALRGELTSLQALGFLALGVAIFVAASAVWRAGTRRYAGASS